jgi:hypothetical protein
MTNTNDDRLTKWIRWIARIWSAPIIAYALIMLIGYTWSWVTTGTADPYAVEDVPPIEILPPILMFMSVLGLGIAWRWERMGGLITLGFQVATLVILAIQRPIFGDTYLYALPYMLSIVVTIPGILFWLCWWRSRRLPASEIGT